jgi:arylsulfatase
LVCKGQAGREVKNFGWELYNVKTDRAELQNVADKNLGKVEELLAKWEKWAVRAKVRPWPYKTK